MSGPQLSPASLTSGLVGGNMRAAVDLLLCVAVVTLCSCVTAVPTIYVKNENDKLEPVMVAVSSTVIPLPIYRVGYGVGVQGPKSPLPDKPPGDYKLLTVPKKKGSGKTISSSDKLTHKKNEEIKKKDIL